MKEILIKAFEEAIKDYEKAIKVKKRLYDFAYSNNLEQGICFYFNVSNKFTKKDYSIISKYLKTKLDIDDYLFPILNSFTEFKDDNDKKQKCLIPRLNLLKELLNELTTTNTENN